MDIAEQCQIHSERMFNQNEHEIATTLQLAKLEIERLRKIVKDLYETSRPEDLSYTNYD